MARANYKKEKLSDRLRVRGRKQAEQADRYAFFFNELPYDVPCLSLEDLHRLVRERWLSRWDADLEQERSLRRKGRPKSTRESELEELKLRDAEEYRTGLELPDLTDEHNVGLLRQWENADPAYLNILRFIRICGECPDLMHITRSGRDGVKKGISKEGEWTGGGQEGCHVASEEGAMTVGVSRVGSCILAMDEIPLS